MWMGSEGEASQQTIEVGSRVTIRDDAGEETFRIVGAEVSDPLRHCISEDSPLAVALLGHRPGEVVRVRAPFDVRFVSVLDVAPEVEL